MGRILKKLCDTKRPEKFVKEHFINQIMQTYIEKIYQPMSMYIKMKQEEGTEVEPQPRIIDNEYKFRREAVDLIRSNNFMKQTRVYKPIDLFKPTKSNSKIIDNASTLDQFNEIAEDMFKRQS